MKLPLLLGEDSVHHAFYTDLATMPHLFLSYSNTAQSQNILNSWMSHLANLHSGTGLRFTGALSGNMGWSLPTALQLYTDVTGTGETAAHRVLMDAWKELKKRQKAILKGSKVTEFPFRIIWLDDVLQLIITRRKFTGMAFVILLLYGHQARMHLVAASSFTYRNLLRQLAQLHPLVQKKLRLSGSEKFQISTSLGAEMVVTAEDLVYFKRANDITYEKFYMGKSMAACP